MLSVIKMFEKKVLGSRKDKYMLGPSQRYLKDNVVISGLGAMFILKKGF